MLFYLLFYQGSFDVFPRAFDNFVVHDNLFNLEDKAIRPIILRPLIGVGAVQTTI